MATLNAIQLMSKCDFYLDVSRNGRFYFADYNKAFNDSIQHFIDSRMGDEEQRDPKNFQWIQQIRDDLYTLIQTASPTITNGTVINNPYFSYTPSHINFPTDYYDFIGIDALIDGFTVFGRPLRYNSKGPVTENSFLHPTNKKIYFNEDSTGLIIYRGVGGTFTSATLEYLRQPLDFSIGNESLLLNPGATIITGTSYIATEISVHNSIIYQIGDQFTAANINLTSGQVIPSASTQTVELPAKSQDDIAKMAAKIMLKVTSNYPGAQAVQSEI